MKYSPLILLPLLANANWLHDVEEPSRRLCKNNVGDGCTWDSDCCGEMECLGVVNWECGHNPGLEGEYCNLAYPCDEDLFCHDGICTDYADLLWNGQSGTCRTGENDVNTNPNPNQFKMMTYNVFLLDCVIGDNVLLACESDEKKAKRVPKLVEWFKDRDEDVVVMQELFSFQEEVIEGMGKAGYCHYVTNFQDMEGSGLGIFSKWPIEEIDFVDWFDALGNGDATDPWNVEAYADKGVMYAKINKHGKRYHVFDTHTQSDSVGDAHETRVVQYVRFREFVESFNIPKTELVLMGGDFNEDKEHRGREYYHSMLKELHAMEVPILGDLKYTQSTDLNSLLARLWGDEEFFLLLDYVLPYYGDYDSNGNPTQSLPATSSCEIIIPQLPDGCDDPECMLSDHFPMTCEFCTDCDAAPPAPRLKVTVKSIKCLSVGDGWHVVEDDEIFLLKDGKQVWPASGQKDFNKNDVVHLTRSEKAHVAAYVDHLPRFDLKESDTLQDDLIGHVTIQGSEIKYPNVDEFGSGATATSKKVWDDGAAKYEIEFEFAYEADWV